MKRVFVVNPPDPDYLSNRITKDMARGYGYETGDVVMLPPLDYAKTRKLISKGKKVSDNEMKSLRIVKNKFLE